jgi:hypothetical protein
MRHGNQDGVLEAVPGRRWSVVAAPTGDRLRRHPPPAGDHLSLVLRDRRADVEVELALCAVELDPPTQNFKPNAGIP